MAAAMAANIIKAAKASTWRRTLSANEIMKKRRQNGGNWHGGKWHRAAWRKHQHRQRENGGGGKSWRIARHGWRGMA